MTPHACPVCQGRGSVPPGFYGLFEADRVCCKSCQGTGVVWETVTGGYEAPLNEAALSGLYGELLFAVSRKHEGETRHQTALRYIRKAEAPGGEAVDSGKVVEP